MEGRRKTSIGKPTLQNVWRKPDKRACRAAKSAGTWHYCNDAGCRLVCA